MRQTNKGGSEKSCTSLLTVSLYPASAKGSDSGSGCSPFNQLVLLMCINVARVLLVLENLHFKRMFGRKNEPTSVVSHSLGRNVMSIHIFLSTLTLTFTLTSSFLPGKIIFTWSQTGNESISFASSQVSEWARESLI